MTNNKLFNLTIKSLKIQNSEKKKFYLSSGPTFLKPVIPSVGKGTGIQSLSNTWQRCELIVLVGNNVTIFIKM